MNTEDRDNSNASDASIGSITLYVNAMQMALDTKGKTTKERKAELNNCVYAIGKGGGHDEAVEDIMTLARRVIEAYKSTDGSVSDKENAARMVANPNWSPAKDVRRINSDPAKPILSVVPHGDSLEYAGSILAVGGVHVLSGAGGVGKSAFIQRVCYDMSVSSESKERLAEYIGQRTCGLSFPAIGFPQPIIYAAGEDSPADIKRNLKLMAQANGKDDLPDEGRFLVMDMSERDPLFGVKERVADADEGFYDLFGEVERIGAGLVVIDPIMSMFFAEANSVTDVRKFLRLLSAEAKRHECGVILIAHSNKRGRGLDADPYSPDMVGNSTAFVDGVRGASSLTRIGDDNRRHALIKMNAGRDNLELEHPLERIKNKQGEPVGPIVNFLGVDNWITRKEAEAKLNKASKENEAKESTAALNKKKRDNSIV